MLDDYYEILGVEVDASEDDIKKAYKKRAMECHPDRASGSEEKFKKLVIAYDVLSKPDSRQKYDRRRNNSPTTFTSRFSKVASAASTTARKVMNDFVDDGLFDVLDKILGRKKESNNIETKVKISIEELYAGADKQIKFKRNEICEECKGRGSEGTDNIKPCVECYGLGRATLADYFTKAECKKCKGTGRIILKKCSSCKGAGEKKYERDFVFPIPKDLNLGKGKDRDTLIMPGEGEYGGDLLIQVNLKTHKYYTVKWPDLYIDLPIQFYQAILGDYLEIETLRGPAVFKVNPGTEQGEIIRLEGYGLRKTKNGSQKLGDLYINIIIAVPKRINKEQRKLLEEYKEYDLHKSLKPKTK